MKIFAKKLLMVSVLSVPLTASALGIKEIKNQSFLHQKLRAEIPIILSKGESLADLKVSLASPKKFIESGLTWNVFFKNIKFETIGQAGKQQAVIKLYSNEYVKEPFLNFLLEVGGTRGTSYKEFTLLFDPRPSSAAINTVAQRSGTTNNTAPAVRSVDNATQLVGNEVTRIQRYDTLWSIGKKLNNDANISTYQFVMALYKANPNAFYKNNINRLISGTLLTIPSTEEITLLSRESSKSEFYQAASAGNQDTYTKITKKTEVVDKKIASQASEQKLTLTAPDAQLSNELVSDNSNTELKQRLERLEEKFTIMQDMLALKERELKVLRDNKEEVLTANNAELADETDLKEDVKDNDLDESLLPESEDSETENTSIETAVVSDPTENETTDLDSEIAKVAKPEITPVTPAVIENKKPQTVVTNEPEPDSYLFFAIGGLALLGLGAGGWFVWRQRKPKKNDVETNVILDGESINDDIIFDENLSDSDFGIEDNALDIDTNNLLDEFDMFADEDDDIDLLVSESDVYLTHGRYEEAEKILLEAMVESPDNEEYQLKYLRIFSVSQNEKGFATYKQQLEDQGKSTDSDFWTEVEALEVEMQDNIQLHPHEDTVEEPEQNEEENEELEDLEGLEGLEGLEDIEINSLLDASEQDLEEMPLDESPLGGGLGADLSHVDDYITNALTDPDKVVEQESVQLSKVDSDIEMLDANFDDLELEDETLISPKSASDVEALDVNFDDLESEDEVATVVPSKVASDVESLEVNFDNLESEDEVAAVIPSKVANDIESLEVDFEVSDNNNASSLDDFDFSEMGELEGELLIEDESASSLDDFGFIGEDENKELEIDNEEISIDDLETDFIFEEDETKKDSD